MTPTNVSGLKNFLLRTLLVPAFFFVLWIFYFEGFSDGADVSSRNDTIDVCLGRSLWRYEFTQCVLRGRLQ